MNLAMRSDTAEIRELLYQLLTSPADRREVVQFQNAGIPVAERLMEAGQKVILCFYSRNSGASEDI